MTCKESYSMWRMGVQSLIFETQTQRGTLYKAVEQPDPDQLVSGVDLCNFLEYLCARLNKRPKMKMLLTLLLQCAI